MKRRFYEELKRNIINSSATEDEKCKMLRNVLQIEENKINLMITGASQAGKSSTINALFGVPIAKVGNGPEPETMSIQKY